MAMQTWIRSENFVDTSTIDNHLLAFDIFDEFATNLFGGIIDSDILEYYNFFLPYKTKYIDSFNVWNSLNSSSPSNTLGVKLLVVQLRGIEIQKWDIAIQGFYPRETSMYVKLFPHFRKDFQNGAVELRVKEVRNLILAIGDDVDLALIKTDVQTFLDLLTAAMTKQESQFTKITTSSVNLEEARIDAADAMMYVYGKLVSKFYKNLKGIETYFPINLLQRIIQELFVATLKNNKIRFLFKRKIDIETITIQVKNVGKNGVIGYFTNGLTNILAAGDLFVTFAPNSQATYNPADMGYTDEKRFFHIVKKGVGTQVVSLKFN